MTGLAAQREAAADRDAVERLMELLSAYGPHDVKALVGLYAQDAVIRVGDLEFRGRDAVTEFWAGWFAAFSDVSSEIERTIVQPANGPIHANQRGTR
jgi:ketosteroid isomerase-like protein